MTEKNLYCIFAARNRHYSDDVLLVTFLKINVMRIDLEEWAKDYAKRKKKCKKKSPAAKLYGLYKGRMYISKDAFDYRIIPLNEIPD